MAKRWLAQRFFSSKINSDPDEINAKIKTIVDRIEANLDKEGQFAKSCDQYTLADVMETVFLSKLYIISNEQQFTPRIKKYYKRMKSMLTFEGAIIFKDLKMMEKMY